MNKILEKFKQIMYCNNLLVISIRKFIKKMTYQLFNLSVKVKC